MKIEEKDREEMKERKKKQGGTGSGADEREEGRGRREGGVKKTDGKKGGEHQGKK